MAVDPQQKTGCCVTDQKDDLHDEQDTASVVDTDRAYHNAWLHIPGRP